MLELEELQKLNQTIQKYLIKKNGLDRQDISIFNKLA